MRLDSLNSMVSAEFRKVEKTDQKSKSTTYDRPKVVKRDSANLSAKGKSSAGEAKNIAARVSVEPDVRTGRVNEVKEKIKNGYYNSPEFADKLADRLIKDFGF